MDRNQHYIGGGEGEVNVMPIFRRIGRVPKLLLRIVACISFFSGLLADSFHSSLLAVCFYLLVRATVTCERDL